MSKIIVIEGPDRTGKQTQTRLLKKKLTKRGFYPIVIEVPIRSAVTYPLIYWMLRNGLAKKFPKIFQWFQYMNRKIFQMFTLPRLEEEHDVIIMDRWSLSTIVYGAAEGVPLEYTMKLANKLRKPDHTFIFYGEAYAHEAEDSYEADSELQQNVRIEYAKWAASHPKSTTLIDCRQDKKVISKKIRNVLYDKGLLERR